MGMEQWRPVWQFKYLNMCLAYDPAISLLGIYPGEMKICVDKDLYKNVSNSLRNYSPKVETQMSVNRMDKKKKCSKFTQWTIKQKKKKKKVNF